MKQFLARILETESVSPDLLRVAIVASEIPPAQPGQFFLVRQNSPYLDPYLRRVWFAPRVVGERVEFWLNAYPHPYPPPFNGRGSEGGDELDFIGPLGRGFQMPRDAQHLLIVAENAQFAAHLIGLVEACVNERQNQAGDSSVLFVCGEPALPEFLIPPEVEYRVGVRAFDAFGEAWQWGDALIASGTRAFYDELKRLALRQLPAQMLLSDILLPCGVGACYTCAIEMRGRLELVCREGPVFDF